MSDQFIDFNPFKKKHYFQAGSDTIAQEHYCATETGPYQRSDSIRQPVIVKVFRIIAIMSINGEWP